jgi:hypothetical protein
MSHNQLPTSFNGNSSFSYDSLSFQLGEKIDKVITFKLEPKVNASGDIEAVCVTNVMPSINVSLPQ